jgi:hypothetical protein
MLFETHAANLKVRSMCLFKNNFTQSLPEKLFWSCQWVWSWLAKYLSEYAVNTVYPLEIRTKKWYNVNGKIFLLILSKNSGVSCFYWTFISQFIFKCTLHISWAAAFLWLIPPDLMASKHSSSLLGVVSAYGQLPGFLCICLAFFYRIPKIKVRYK